MVLSFLYSGKQQQQQQQRVRFRKFVEENEDMSFSQSAASADSISPLQSTAELSFNASTPSSKINSRGRPTPPKKNRIPSIDQYN
jgi:hypothetical protein